MKREEVSEKIFENDLDFKFKKIYIDFEVVNKPVWVKIMVCQLQTKLKNWECKNRLYYLKNDNYIKSVIDEVLNIGLNNNVNLIVFPELTVPENFIKLLKGWSKDKNIFIVAGSHYFTLNNNTVSRCPVIYNNEVYYTQKLVPSYKEYNICENRGLNYGNEIIYFKNTSIGNFIILICLDNLIPVIRNAIIDKDLDFLIVPAFQNDSNDHFYKFHEDCNSANNHFCIYANNKAKNYADGKSAFFGNTTSEIVGQLKNEDKTDFKPEGKLCQLDNKSDFFVLDVNIAKKSPSARKRPELCHHNIKKLKFGSLKAVNTKTVETKLKIEKTINTKERKETTLFEINNKKSVIEPKEIKHEKTSNRSNKSLIKNISRLFNKVIEFKKKINLLFKYVSFALIFITIIYFLIGNTAIKKRICSWGFPFDLLCWITEIFDNPNEKEKIINNKQSNKNTNLVIQNLDSFVELQTFSEACKYCDSLKSLSIDNNLINNKCILINISKMYSEKMFKSSIKADSLKKINADEETIRRSLYDAKMWYDSLKKSIDNYQKNMKKI